MKASAHCATRASPRVSVVMPVFNRDRFLSSAIDSVLAQSYPNFELIVIDDGSTDNSLEVMHSYADPRVRIAIHDSNQGLAVTRNHGLALARGEYIAWLDSDDYACPKRFEAQVDFLNANPDIAVAGSWYRRGEAPSQAGKLKARPEKPAEVQAALLFTCCLHQPTVMGRADILRDYLFDTAFGVAEDYDVWVRLSAAYKLVNLPTALTRCRLHCHQQTRTRKNPVEAYNRQIQARQLDTLGIAYGPSDLARHAVLLKKNRTGDDVPLDRHYLLWAARWLHYILAQNEKRGIYQHAALQTVIAQIWLKLCIRGARAIGLSEVPALLSAPKLLAMSMRRARGVRRNSL